MGIGQQLATSLNYRQIKKIGLFRCPQENVKLLSNLKKMRTYMFASSSPCSKEGSTVAEPSPRPSSAAVEGRGEGGPRRRRRRRGRRALRCFFPLPPLSCCLPPGSEKGDRRLKNRRKKTEKRNKNTFKIKFIQEMLYPFDEPIYFKKLLQHIISTKRTPFTDLLLLLVPKKGRRASFFLLLFSFHRRGGP